MRIGISALLGLGVAMLASVGRTEDWPQFRGPSGAGVSAEKDLPKEWGMDKNVRWKVPTHGRGWSSPIIWGDKIILTAAFSEKEPQPKAGSFGMPGFGGGGGRPGGGPGGGGGRPGGPPGGGAPPGGRPGGGGGGFGGPGPKPPDAVYHFEVLCLDRATGKELWKQVALESKPRIATHQSNTYASETPVTDGERVYAYFGMHGLYCYDLNSKLVWKHDLGSFPMMMGWGTGSSPVIDGDRVYLQVDNEQKSFLVALDKMTGDEVWRVDRTEKSSWSSPYLWKNKHRSELILATSQRARSYDPANGKVLWELSMGGGQGNATPVGDDERLYFGVAGGPGGGGGGPRGPGGPRGGGAGGPPGGGPPGQGGRGPGGFGGAGMLYAVKAGASGDITPKQGELSSAGVAWAVVRVGPQMASPLVYQGFVYVVEQSGMMSCLDEKTGKAAYTKERIPNAKQFWASPWAYDGKIFCIDDGGTTHVVQAGPEFKVLAKNKLDDQFWTSTAIAGGALILRGVENIYCISSR